MKLLGAQSARRLWFRKSELLVLDEAVVHLDLERERRVNAAVNRLKITRNVIAHRSETIASTDRVLMVEGGRCQGIPPRVVSPRNNRPARNAGLL